MQVRDKATIYGILCSTNNIYGCFNCQKNCFLLFPLNSMSYLITIVHSFLGRYSQSTIRIVFGINYDDSSKQVIAAATAGELIGPLSHGGIDKKKNKNLLILRHLTMLDQEMICNDFFPLCCVHHILRVQLLYIYSTTSVGQSTYIVPYG